MNLFYFSEIKEPLTVLPEQESKHIIRVLRKKAGDSIYFTNGRGIMYDCTIIDDNPKKCIIQINKKQNGNDKRDYHIHIALAPTKNIDRTEFFIEKCTEIGIDEITPIITFHSERRDIKHERLEKVAVSAMKQSLKSHLPQINNKQEFNDFINHDYGCEKYIAYIDPDVNVRLVDSYIKGNDIIILIGPEGDFSDDEFKLAVEKGYKPISLGDSRLRTETAGIVACNIISVINSMGK